MKISFITPTPYIKDYGSQSDFILALSHLINLKNETEYEKAIKETQLPLWLDNGLFENKEPESLDSLLDKAKKINAYMFFSPDYLYDSKKTKHQIAFTHGKMVQKGLVRGYRFANSNEIKMGAVVQAEDKANWLSLYKDFCNDDRIDIIGLSILAIPYVYKLPIAEARIECMKDLLLMNIKHKTCHLLGLGSSLKDVIFAKENCPWIETHDSSSAFWNAIQDKKILNNGEVEGGKTEVKVDFNFKDATKEQLELAQNNINQYKTLCQ